MAGLPERIFEMGKYVNMQRRCLVMLERNKLLILLTEIGVGKAEWTLGQRTHENMSWIYIPNAQARLSKDFFAQSFISQNLSVETSSW